MGSPIDQSAFGSRAALESDAGTNNADTGAEIAMAHLTEIQKERLREKEHGAPVSVEAAIRAIGLPNLRANCFHVHLPVRVLHDRVVQDHRR